MRYYSITQGNNHLVKLEIYQKDLSELDFEDITRCFGILNKMITAETMFEPEQPNNFNRPNVPDPSR